MIFSKKFAATILIASLSFSCNQTQREILPNVSTEKVNEKTSSLPSQFTFNNRLSRYVNGDIVGAEMYVKNIDFTLHYLSENGVDFSNLSAVNQNAAIADGIFANQHNVTIVNAGLSNTPVTLQQYLASNQGSWTASQTVVLNSISQALSAGSYELFLSNMEVILTSNTFASLSSQEALQVSNLVLVLDYTLQYLSEGIGEINTNLPNATKPAPCDGWWACWGKCTAGILGGVLGGGLAGALGGSTVPAVGTVTGGVVGALAGGLSGAAQAC
jgi:hypothetical protein